MKHLFCTFWLAAGFLIISTSGLFASTNAFLNRIEGQIFDENRSPVGDLYVELLTEVDSPISTQRATPSGRFTFANLTIGTFRIRVLPSGRNFLGETKEVRFIASLRGATDDVQFVEFYLRYDKRATSISFEASPDAIFVQDVPAGAKKLYQAGVEDLDRKQEKGLGELEEAVQNFPEYFDALSRLGKEYVMRQNYDKAYPYLLKAIDRNPRSYSSYYALAFAFYQLKQIPAAIKAAEACTFLRGDSIEARILYGTLLRINGDFQDAEKELKKALSIAKSPNAEIHWQLALLFNRLGRNKEAADELELYLKIAPPEAANKKEIRDLIAKLRAAKQT